MAGDSHFRMLKVKCGILLAIACLKRESAKKAARQCGYSPTFYCCLMVYDSLQTVVWQCSVAKTEAI